MKNMDMNISTDRNILEGDKIINKKKTKIALFVLGAHRSGTSMLTRVLNLSGWELSEDLIPPQTNNNSKGFWEIREIVELNKLIMKELNLSWDTIQKINNKQLEKLPSIYMMTAKNILKTLFENHTHVVLKDPRFCILFPFWLKACKSLGIKVAVVSIVRSPVEVADSLWKRNGTPRSYAALMWLNHVISAEFYSRKIKRVYCNYETFIDNWKEYLVRFQKELKDYWPQCNIREKSIKEFISYNERHNISDIEDIECDIDMNLWVKEVYFILKQWGEKGEKIADYRSLDRIREIFYQAAPALKSLVNALDLDKRRRPYIIALEMNERLQKAYANAQRKVLQLKEEKELIKEEKEKLIHMHAKEINKLNEEIRVLKNNIEFIEKTNNDKEKYIKDLELTLKEIEKRLEELEEYAEKYAFKIFAPIRALLSDLIQNGEDTITDKIHEIRSLYKKYGLFDEDWYKKKYMIDSKLKNIDPFLYYIKYGVKKKHFPNKIIHDTIWMRRMIEFSIKNREV